MHDQGGTRTLNLWIRSPAPYPLGHMTYLRHYLLCYLTRNDKKIACYSKFNRICEQITTRIELRNFYVLGK